MFSALHANSGCTSLILAGPPSFRHVSSIISALPAIPRAARLNYSGPLYV